VTSSVSAGSATSRSVRRPLRRQRGPERHHLPSAAAALPLPAPLLAQKISSCRGCRRWRGARRCSQRGASCPVPLCAARRPHACPHLRRLRDSVGGPAGVAHTLWAAAALVGAAVSAAADGSVSPHHRLLYACVVAALVRGYAAAVGLRLAGALLGERAVHVRTRSSTTSVVLRAPVFCVALGVRCGRGRGDWGIAAT